MQNTKDFLTLNEWFAKLVKKLDDCGITFNCIDSVTDDYNDGKSVEEMTEIIKAEYL